MLLRSVSRPRSASLSPALWSRHEVEVLLARSTCAAVVARTVVITACDDGIVSGGGPESLACGEIVAVAVPGAGRVIGARADAVVAVEAGEHARRVAVGLGAVPDYSTLYALMCLPLNTDVRVVDLGDVVHRLLQKAPPGCVDWLDDRTRVRRRYTPAATAPLVVIRGATWRPALRRAAAFEPFAARVVLLSGAPRHVAGIAWEADVDGTGLWITRPSGEIEEVVAPAPYVEHYVKPAGWRFAEYAYAAWLGHDGAVGSGTTTARADPAVILAPGVGVTG